MIRKLLVSILTGLVRGYQLVVSPWFAPTCRYYPSCSTYAIQALKVHGPIKGLYLSTWRLLRCNPWSRGGVDHVPPHKSSRGINPESVAHGAQAPAATHDSFAIVGTGRTSPETAAPSWSTLHGNI